MLRNEIVIMKYILLIILIFITNNSLAREFLIENYKYYKIFPEKDEAIFPELEANTPISINGVKYYALTEWSVTWEFKTRIIKNQCRTTKVTSYVDVEYTLPELAVNLRAPKSTTLKFKKFMRKLMMHERLHKRSGLKAAKAIVRELGNLKQTDTCLDFHEVLNKKAGSIIERFKLIDIQIDKQTDHGRRQIGH
jgi:predicted secreted Zn-dependent protease